MKPPDFRISRVRSTLACAAIGLALLAAGTLVHEIIGHGGAAIALGGRITVVGLFGVQIYPTLETGGWPRAPGYGYMDYQGFDDPQKQRLVDLAGSFATWFVALGANMLLWTRRRWTGWPRIVMVILCLYWIDLFTYTLPSWGFRRSILWGARFSEPYEAAVALGINGNLFRAFVLITSAAMLAALLFHFRRALTCPANRPRQPQSPQ